MNAQNLSNANDRLFGVGMYSVREAALLTGTKPIEVQRWLFGYDFKTRDGDESSSPPLWTTEHAGKDIDAIGFHDLLELRFVKAFRRHGVSQQAIRVAASYAREIFKSSHPFTTKRFRTDGRSIFGEVHEKTGDPALVDMVKRQDVFRSIVEPGLYTGIEFDLKGRAAKWYPANASKRVVLDPQLAFGAPIVVRGSVPTSVLSAAYIAEGRNADMVGRIYEVPRASVLAAVNFEQQLAA
jgi:uncharacterized protein (DUF433 family)